MHPLLTLYVSKASRAPRLQAFLIAESLIRQTSCVGSRGGTAIYFLTILNVLSQAPKLGRWNISAAKNAAALE